MRLDAPNAVFSLFYPPLPRFLHMGLRKVATREKSDVILCEAMKSMSCKPCENTLLYRTYSDFTVGNTYKMGSVYA